MTSVKFRVRCAALSTALLVASPLINFSPVMAQSIANAAVPESLVTDDVKEETKLKFNGIFDRFLADMYEVWPSWATALGVHRYDDKLDDFSSEGVAKEIKLLHAYLSDFESLDGKNLTLSRRHDLEVIKGRIRAHLQDLEDLKWWKRNPDHYSSSVSSSVFGLVKRNFASPEVRMRAVIAREMQIPTALAEGKKNLDPQLVPQIYAELAAEQLPGIIDFFQTSVPDAFKDVKNDSLQNELSKTQTDVIAALKDYQQFLQQDLLAKGACKGSFALGEEAYKTKLFNEEMVDEPIDKLLEKGDAELKRLQDQFVAVGKEIDPNKPVNEVFESLAKDHPQPSHLLGDIKDLLEGLRAFCVDKHIVTLPLEDRPVVEETPPFMRALTFASIDSAGPLEKKVSETFYNVTLPAPDWSAQKTEEFMRTFSYPDLKNTSVHEAYPGHFVQFLWLRKAAPSTIRKIFECGSNSEGWAHYCEQMMLDEGYGNGDKKLRMIQLHDALLRACRYEVGLRMHTRGMTLDEGIRYFMEQGYQEKANAEREAKRGTSDPTYLVYTLGKLKILEIREQYKAKKGAAYSVQNFHDAFLGRGGIPLSLVQEELLADEPMVSKAAETPAQAQHKSGKPAAAIDWTDNLSEAQNRAEKENKLVLIDFYTTWCPDCKGMDKFTFKNKQVISTVNASFIPVHLNAEDAVNGQKIADAHQVTMYPTFLVMNGKGTVVAKFLGYTGAHEYISKLNNITAKNLKH